MSLNFYDGLNNQTSVTVLDGLDGSFFTYKSSLGYPTVVSNIALQGFYMTYGPTSEHNVSWMEARVSISPPSKTTGNDWKLNYKYKDFMTDGTGPNGSGGTVHTASGYVKSLALASFSS